MSIRFELNYKRNFIIFKQKWNIMLKKKLSENHDTYIHRNNSWIIESLDKNSFFVWWYEHWKISRVIFTHSISRSKIISVTNTQARTRNKFVICINHTIHMLHSLCPLHITIISMEKYTVLRVWRMLYSFGCCCCCVAI